MVEFKVYPELHERQYVAELHVAHSSGQSFKNNFNNLSETLNLLVQVVPSKNVPLPQGTH